jgi:hypothetical protein
MAGWLVEEESMNTNLDKVREMARDLTTEEPRHASEKLAGFEMAARCLDKCRATLAGCEGDYRFGCPMDQEFFAEAGIEENEFRDFVATGASDEEVEQWVTDHARSAP